MTPTAPACDGPLPALAGWGIAAVATLLLAIPLRACARRRGWLSAPRGERSGPGGVPLLGGAAVLAGTALGCSLVGAGCGVSPAGLLGRGWAGGGIDGRPLALLIAGLALVGGLDDRRPLPAGLRLALELGGAGIALHLAFGSHLHQAAQLQYWMGIAAGALGLVFLANAFNMADNADGLAAGAGSLSFLALAAAGSGALWVWAVSGALAGFFVWNRPPARIYLGDLGSLPLGGLLGFALAGAIPGALPGSGIPGEAPSAPGLLVAAAAAALAAGYLLFDPVYVILSRLRRGAAPWRGGRDHPSHHLARAFGGWPRGLGVVLVVQAYSVLTGWLVLRGWAPAAALAPGFAAWVILLAAARRRPPPTAPRRPLGRPLGRPGAR